MQDGGLGRRKTNTHNLHTRQTHSEGYTLLWGSVRRHWPLPHHMVPLVDLTHHSHRVLLPLVVLCGSTRRHVILLGGRLLVHHRACCDKELTLMLWQKSFARTTWLIKMQEHDVQQVIRHWINNTTKWKLAKELFYLDQAACSCLAEAHSFPWAGPGSCSFGSELACPGKKGRCDCNHPSSHGCWGAYSQSHWACLGAGWGLDQDLAWACDQALENNSRNDS